MGNPKTLIIVLIIIVFIITGVVLLQYFSTTRKKEEFKEKRICIYAGSGAVFVREVEEVLKKLNLSYYLIDENFIKSGKLMKYCTILIIPGGYTSTYVSSLGKEGFDKIREFVASGGGYIGICAGAYLAAKIVEVPGKPEGLGIINITNVRKSGRGLVNITIVNPNHPLAKDCPKVMKIWYQNGPYIIPGKGVEVIAVYNEKYAAIVCSRYGKGTVVIFSPHPEGCLSEGADPVKLGTIKLLRNAIYYILQQQGRS